MKLKILSLVLILLFSALAICACGQDDNTDEPDKNTEDSIQSSTEHICIPVTNPEVLPTCTENGKTEGSRCSECNKVLVPQKPIAALGHTWIKADCTTPKTCAVCNATDGEALGHKKVTYETVAATCTTDGQSDGSYCSICDKVFKNPTVTPALGHNETPREGKEATCTEGGQSGGSYCSTCGQTLSEPVPTQPLGHKEIIHASSAPTCNQVGWNGYISCSRCDYTTYEELPITDHLNGKWILGAPAKAGKNGLEHIICVECGEIMKTEVIPALVPSKGLEFKSNGDGTCAVVGIGTCSDKDIVIPYLSPDGDTVTSIGENAFSYKKTITSVWISDDVKEIGNSAFRECLGLTSVSLPNSLTSIGENAFYNCYKLVEIYNESGIEVTAGNQNNGYIGNYALNIFKAPQGISNLNTTDDGYIFYIDGETRYLIGYNGNNGELVLPRDYKGKDYLIYDYTFSNNISITSVIIPDSLTNIGKYAFSDCSRLSSVIIGNGINHIDEYAFNNCSELVHVTIGSNVDSIASNSFQGCNKLYEICNRSEMEIAAGGENYSRIGYYALNVYTPDTGESKLYTTDDGYIFYIDYDIYLVGYIGTETVIDLPTSCQGQNYSIYQNAFYKNRNITSVTIPDSVESIGNAAFNNCHGISELIIGNNVVSIGNEAFFGCRNIANVIIPDRVKNIGTYAFSGCIELTSVTIGKGIEAIGEGAFQHCEKLSVVDITDIAAWCEIELGSLDSNPLYLSHNLYSNGELVTELVIPDTVTRIENAAFAYCYSLTNVTLGKNISYIGNTAFWCCYKIIEVHNKSQIAISTGNDSGGCVAFYAQRVYTSEYENSYLKTTDNGYIFYIQGDIRYLIGYNGNESELVLPTDYQGMDYEIYNYAFYKRDITSITISDRVTTIDYCVFGECSELTSITFTGTKSEWKAITKNNNWDKDADSYTIYCTDGTIAKDGTET